MGAHSRLLLNGERSPCTSWVTAHVLVIPVLCWGQIHKEATKTFDHCLQHILSTL